MLAAEIPHSYCNTNLTPAGKLKNCFELWELMGTEGNRDVSSFNIMMRGLFNNCEVDKFISIWELLKKTGFVSDYITYGILVHGFCKNGYKNKALLVLETTEAEGGVLDAFAYSAMINELCKEGKLAEATTLLSLNT